MAHSNKDIDRIEQAFAHARSQLASVPSSGDEIARRIAATAIKTTRPTIFACAAIALGIAALGSFLWWRPRNAPPLPRAVFVSPFDETKESKMEMGDAELTTYIAAIIEHRGVVVIWRCRGGAVMPATANAAEDLAGKYRSSILHDGALADGSNFVCSLFIAKAGVQPVLEPPSIYARAADNRVVAMSVSPRAASTVELAAAIQSAGGGGRANVRVEDIVQEARKQLHDIEAKSPRKDSL